MQTEKSICSVCIQLFIVLTEHDRFTTPVFNSCQPTYNLSFSCRFEVISHVGRCVGAVLHLFNLLTHMSRQLGGGAGLTHKFSLFSLVFFVTLTLISFLYKNVNDFPDIWCFSCVIYHLFTFAYVL